MDNSDDYFDDLVIDDQLLAVLDQEESKYAATQAQNVPKPTSRNHNPPPAKRLKTAHVPAKRPLTPEDDFDLPEISLQNDSYVVGPIKPNSNNSSYRPSPTPAPLTRSNTHNNYNYNHVKPKSANNIAPVNANAVAGPSRQPPISRQVSGPVFNAHRPLHAPIPESARNLQRRQSSYNVFGSQGMPRASQPRPSQAGGSDMKAKMEIEILRTQLEEAKKEKEKAEQRLKEAEDARFAKEGEVSILRATLHKTSEQHAAEIARERAAREATEAAKLQLMKDQKEEMERIKTQFAFKQHEFETSSRKAPWSVSKKLGRQIPSTPVKTPAQIRDWNMPGGHSTSLVETPRRPRFGAVDNFGSQRPRSKLAPVIEERTKRSSALPGFENAFLKSPSRTQRQKDKGKGRQQDDRAAENIFFTGHARSSPPSSPSFPTHAGPPEVTMDDVEPPRSSDRPGDSRKTNLSVDLGADLGAYRDEDVQMADNQVSALDLEENISEGESPNWRDEMYHVIFTHCLRQGATPSMQLLLDSPLPPTTPPEQRQAYSAACTHLLDNLGASARLLDWDTHLHTLAAVLSELARLLNHESIIYPLSSLLNLLRILCYTIPSFTSALLSATPDNQPPWIIQTLRDIVLKQLPVIKCEVRHSDVDGLATETLNLVEALALMTPEELTPQLVPFIRGPKILYTLLHIAQPTAIVSHCVHALSLLASHANLSTSLRSSPLDEPRLDDGRLQHIDQLGFYLVDPARSGPEVDKLRENIITFIATLALTGLDALYTLQRSKTLIPSIIVYLAETTEPFWEDDESLVSSPAEIDRVLRVINRTIALLFYIVFTTPVPLELNWLSDIHQKYLKGASHMFIVTMGRFSFAYPPDWLDEAAKIQFEQTTGMANHLLQQCVTGPEVDQVWNAFQPESKAADEDVDDEEHEARLLHPAYD